MCEPTEIMASNFIHEIIDKDLAEGRIEKVHTRFPPEPNGYLHIGHAKGILINYLTAKKYGGSFNLRYDDTNPAKEDDEFVKSIYEDMRWLGVDPDGGVFFGSDYFPQCYDFAVQLIKDGKAYICDLSPEEMREYRGTLHEPGKNSPYRERGAEENLALFAEMRAGGIADGTKTLRAKIDMSSPNLNMRDPVIYRILHAHHHRQGDAWCIYPMYDFAHPIQDALEGITHSCCSIEFENHRPLYDWVIENIGFEHQPHQYEFAKLNITYTMMGKRYLRELVERGIVDGWDDPRMPTICGLRRRGYTSASITDFIKRVGVAKSYNLVDISLLDFCIRDELSKTALRRVAVLDPIKVILTNYPEGQSEDVTLQNNPEDPEAGTRTLAISRELYIDRADFEEVPPPKFHRLSVGKEVRLMGTYFITCQEIVKDEAGKVTELHCTYDPATFSGSSPEGRKVKGTIHWLPANTAEDAEIRVYGRLFTLENMGDMPEDTSYDDHLNKDSIAVYKNAKLEPCLKDAPADIRYQFVRSGYFIQDNKHPSVYNQIVPLKDSYSK